MQSKMPLLALYWSYARYTGTRGFLFSIWNCLGGRYLYFWSDFNLFLFSLVHVPLFFNVESENAAQIALNCIVFTLHAAYGYARIFFFWNLQMSGRALSFFLFLFLFFFGGGGGGSV